MERLLPFLPVRAVRFWVIGVLMLMGVTASAQAPFITTWKTDNPGESITIPINPDVTGYNYTVDWGDGNISNHTGEAVHTYASADTYEVSISGDFPAIRLRSYGIEVSDKLVSIEQWGDIAWSSMEGAFSGARYMVLNATDAPNLSGVASLAMMFDGASSLNSDLSGWNVSNITDMSLMFNMASSFNGNITGWDVSNVTNMYGMFWYGGDFNQDIGGWSVSQVADMSYMFYSAADFNQDLSGWVTSNVTNMAGMFSHAMAFDQSLGSWDISSVTDMDDMLLSTGLSTANYGATLIGWAALPTVPSNITLDATGQEYCPGSAAETARQELEMKEWNIIGDNPATDCGGGGADITPGDPGNFVTIWRVDAAISNVDIVIPTHPDEAYNYAIAWEGQDGVLASGSAAGVTGDFTIPIISSGTTGAVKVEITGQFPRIFLEKFAGEPIHAGKADKLLSVDQWGSIAWTSMEGAFHSAENLQVVAMDLPDLSRVTSLKNMYHLATSFTGNSTMADWDVRNITDMSGMFTATQFNQPIGGWNMSNVTDMHAMFNGTPFNQDIGEWDVAKVVNMDDLFANNYAFNRYIGDWDVSKVERMVGMFRNAMAFNQDITGWDVSAVTNMTRMFLNAAAFDQDLGDWDISSVSSMQDMLKDAGFSMENYDATLIGWAAQENVPSNIMLGADNLTFCAGAEARQQLIDELGWNITGDVPACASMLIFVETEDGKTLIILTEGSDAIQQVKQKIQDKAGIHPNQQQLFFAGDELEDGHTLNDYHIENGNTLNLIVNAGPVITPGDHSTLYVDINVNTSATGYTGAGDSWANAIPELADALKWAREQHDGGSPGWTEAEPLRIFVATGVYVPLYNGTTGGGRDNSFVLVPSVQIYGGFDPSTGIETLEDARILPDYDGSAVTGSVLNGDLDGNDVAGIPVADLLNHASRQDNALNVVRADGSVGSAMLDGFVVMGGNDDSEPGGAGGGIQLLGSSPAFRNLIITNNAASYGGGGMRNTGSSPTVTHVAFRHNWAVAGGAIANFGGSNPMLTNVAITDNIAANEGGGIYNNAGNGVFTNTTIAGNMPDAIYAFGWTTWNNTIVWGGVDGENFNAKNSLIEGNADTDDGNLDATGITADDIFTDPANGDYTLKENSPAINVGDNTLYTDAGGNLADDPDVAGNPRVYNQGTGGIIDLGAYEFQEEFESPVTPDENNVVYVDINVDTDAPGYTGAGDSWANAIPELADALKWAKENETAWTTDNPLEIWVAAGTYTPLYSPADDNFGHPAGRETAFLAVKNVKIYGGFAGGETSTGDRNWAANHTILSGEIQHDDEMANNAFHVFMVAGDIGVGLLDGVIVEAGSSLDDFGETTTVNGLQFTNRYCGGIYIMNADIRIQNAIIRKNAGQSIAALLHEGGATTLINVSIVDNLGDLQGFDSGAVYSEDGGNLKLVNVTIAGNEGYFGGINIVGDGEIRNSIIWGNVYDGEVNANYDFGDAILENNLIEGYTGGGSNINGDPLFTDQTNGDYTLLSGSPAVNAGNNTGYTGVGGDLANDLDLAGNPRVSNHAAGGVIDMGAYEFQEEFESPVTPDENNVVYVDINVNTDATGYTGTGDSWANAIPELADALRWAREQHDGGSPDWSETDPLRIFVAKGTYKPLYNADDEHYTTDGNRDNSFVLVPHVQLYGGFDPSAGIETMEDPRILPDINNLEQGSILSGDFNGNDNTDNFDNHTENAHHVTIAVGDVGSALMDGFTIAGGYANTGGGVTVFGRTVRKENGGGTVVITSSPQLTHMAWSTNYGFGGGGLFNSVNYLTEESSPTLTQVTFFGNAAPFGGGGIWNYHGYVEIIGAVFVDNGAGHETDGTSSGPGGAISSTKRNNERSLDVTNATFYGNWIVGVFLPGWNGAAIHVGGSTATLTNVIAWDNEVEGDATATSASVSVSDAEVTVANSLMANLGGSGNWNSTVITDGGNNIDADPVFVSTTPGDAGYLQLSACSPAISTGSNQLYIDAGGDLANDLDMGGNPRVYNFVGGGVIDMGAYEYQGERVHVQSLTMPDAVQVAYGTEMEDVEALPTAVTATLSDDTDVAIPLDGNLANWTLVSPAGGTYDGDVAGTYVFTVQLLTPETECYLNPENLQAEVTIEVAKGTPALAASWNGAAIDATEGLSLTYGNVGELLFSTTDTDGELTYAFGDGDAPVLDLADLSAVAAQQAGTATLTIAQVETDNYEAAAVEIVVTVAPKTVTVVPVADQGKIYGANEPAAYGYELAEGDVLAFDDELADIVSATSRESGENVGAYDIELVFSGGQADNYAITFEADNNAFTVTPLAVTVKAEDKSKVFGSDDPALTYTFTPDLIGDDAFAGGLARDEGDDVGDYAITQGDLSLDDNYAIAFEAGTLTITPAGYKGIEFNSESSVYDGTEHVLELRGELPEGATVTYEIDDEAGNGATDAGTYEVKAFVDGGGNYEDAELTAILTITPLEIAVTAENKTKVFGTDDPALTYTYAPALIGADEFIGDINREPGDDVGSYAITQGGLLLDGNYSISFTAGTLTIMSADYEGIAFNDVAVTYDGTEHVLELTGELPEGVSVTYDINGEPGNSATDAGTYEVTANIDGGDNYDDITLTATLTIEKAIITGLRFEDREYIYQGAEWEILINGDLPAGADVTYADNQQVDVGEYEATAIVSGDNYNSLELHAKFTILPLQLTVTADHKQKIYGSGDPALTYTAVPALVGEDSFTGGLVREDGEAVGEYTIMQGDLSAGDNYEIAFEAGILTIVSAGYQDVVFNNASFVYDGEAKSLEIDGALPEGATVRYTIDGDGGNEATDAGTYEVTAVVDGGDNYGDLELTATLEITPAERTMDFPALPERTYGDDDFDAGAAASSGEDITYTSSNAAVAEVTGGGLIRIVGAGEATITAMVPENNNYSSRPQASRTLTVNKAQQVITFNAPAEVNRDAGSIELDVSAASGLPVSLTLDDEQVATLEGITLNIHRLGMVTVTATQAGDDNYEAAEPVMVTVRVVDPQAELPVRVHKVISPNGDGINEFLMIEGVRGYPENRMTIVNRNGTIVWEAEGYDNANTVFRGTFTGGHNAPAGTYFYILEVRVDGGWKHEKGWFVLRY